MFPSRHAYVDDGEAGPDDFKLNDAAQRHAVLPEPDPGAIWDGDPDLQRVAADYATRWSEGLARAGKTSTSHSVADYKAIFVQRAGNILLVRGSAGGLWGNLRRLLAKREGGLARDVRARKLTPDEARVKALASRAKMAAELDATLALVRERMKTLIEAEYRFSWESQGKLAEVPHFKRPAKGSEPTQRVDSLGGLVDADEGDLPVADSVITWLRHLKKHGRVHFGAGTYGGHDWDEYSVDVFLGGAEPNGFYDPAKAAKFFEDVAASAQATGVEWKALYNDFDLAKTVNTALGERRISFQWHHGPAPFVLHVHFNIMPKARGKAAGVSTGAAAAKAATGEADAEQDAAPDRYGGYDLQLGDRDHATRPTYGGAARTAADVLPAAGARGFVVELQRDLRELGFSFVPRTGRFDALTRQAVRELQIHARMLRLAQEAPPPAAPATAPARYVDRLAAVANASPYSGPVSGVVNARTRTILADWRANRWRCPVVIEAWQVDADGNRIGAGPVAGGGNLWRHDQLENGRVHMFARDFSASYTMPSGRSADDLIELGKFVRYHAYSGPEAKPNDHTCWPEAEMMPANVVGVAISDLTAEQRSCFKVFRAIAEVECIGFLDGINSYDNVFASLGPCHWPIGAASTGWAGGGELGGYLAYLREVEPLAFMEAIEACGVKAEKEWRGDGHELFSRRQRRYSSRLVYEKDDGSSELVPLTNAEMSWFRSWHWFYRFSMAARTITGFQRRMWHMLRIRLRDVLATTWRHGAPDVVQPDGTHRPVTIGDYYTSERAVAMLVRWHVRAPGHMVFDGAGAQLRAAFRRARVPADLADWQARAGESAADHQARLDGYQEALVAGLARQAVTHVDTMPQVRAWPRWGSNPYGFRLDPDRLDPVERRLSLAHGSFRMDSTDLPAAPPP